MDRNRKMLLGLSIASLAILLTENRTTKGMMRRMRHQMHDAKDAAQHYMHDMKHHMEDML